MTASDKEAQNQQQPIPYMDNQTTHKPVDCQSIASERNHYFKGKLMTARDLTQEAEYILSHTRAHNRLMHGTGIVCGLTVEARKGKERCLDIHPGVALDCCGRELIVRERITRELSVTVSPEDDNDLLVCLQYREDMVEYLSALYAEGKAPGHREANRIREGVSVIFKRRAELPGCWKVPSGDANASTYVDCDDCDDCGEPCASRDGCLDPACACEDLIPLARLTYQDDGTWKIDMDGRPVLPNSCQLTQISAINWLHGGLTDKTVLNGLAIPALTDEEKQAGASDYALLIKFNRKIQPSTENGTGINPYTFTVVSSSGPFRSPYDTEDEPNTEHQRQLVKLLDDGYTAIYRFTRGETRGKENIFNTTLFINLKCDFILDCNGNPVDGNHLAAKIPTGDGVPGGQFESWTRIVSEK